MIPVIPAAEPAGFDDCVRLPGYRALAEMVGLPSYRTNGNPFPRIAATCAEIPSDRFPPYWRNARDELLSAYGRICSYLNLYIPKGVSAPSVDHMVPRSTAWHGVYEWSNYRLACSLMNSRKGAATGVLDPFSIQDGWFALETVEFQLVPGHELPENVLSRVLETIERLKLNDSECCAARMEYALEYWEGNITFDFLQRHAPFVARELRRQGRLVETDR